VLSDGALAGTTCRIPGFSTFNGMGKHELALQALTRRPGQEISKWI
jgi:hypothetical protein